MKFFLALVTASLAASFPVWADNVVVLPFYNASHTPNLDWVGESVSETIWEAIATQGLMIVTREDRQEAFRRLGLRLDANPTRATLLKVGQALDAGQVVYGEFELIPPPAGATNTRGNLRFTAHILDLKHVKRGPDFGELGAIEELAERQSHLAWQTIQFLSPKMSISESDFRKRWPPVRVDAIESFMRGMLATNLEQRSKLFTQALRLEPGYSDAAFQMGLLSSSKKDYRTASEWLAKVSPSDVHYSQASFFLGICRFNAGDYAGAQTAFERVAAAVPLNEVFNNLGVAQSRRGLPDSIANFQKAVEGDPTDPAYHFNLGYALWRQGKYAEGADSFRAVLDRNPQDQEATVMLGRCLKGGVGKPPALKEGLERLKTNYEESAYRQLRALLPGDQP